MSSNPNKECKKPKNPEWRNLNGQLYGNPLNQYRIWRLPALPDNRQKGGNDENQSKAVVQESQECNHEWPKSS